MAELSPAAQALLDALPPYPVHPPAIAAALRTLADELVPLKRCRMDSTRGTTRLRIRQRIRGIAEELEAAES